MLVGGGGKFRPHWYERDFKYIIKGKVFLRIRNAFEMMENLIKWVREMLSLNGWKIPCSFAKNRCNNKQKIREHGL